ncbi:MAG: hypothetical protein SVM80_09955 [Halobacteriota archaeon]|nr:hypothetical protein [Halobacteriota archaeon]
MGRTVRTYRNVLDGLISEWYDFRQALRNRDRESFDRLMEKARIHSSASSYALRLNPMESMFMSILLEQEKELDNIRKWLKDLEDG